MNASLQVVVTSLTVILVTACDISRRADEIIVPLTIVHENDLHVQLSLGGRDLLFLVDTGASCTAVDARILKSLELPPPCQHLNEVRLGISSQTKEHFHNVKVVVGGRTFVFSQFQAADFSTVMPAVDDPLASAVGVLGADFMVTTGATIDFKRRQIRIPTPVASRITRKGEQDGPANGSQPIRLETNRTSSAAGSRR
jgi:hypothetical protein